MDTLDKIEPDEITIRGLILKVKSVLRYIKSKWPTIAIFTILGLLIGIVYSVFEKPIYKSTSTFVLGESGHSSGLGDFSGLASLVGGDIGGGSDKGLFQGDNILELYRSRLMIEKTLLTNVKINGKNELLIDRYIEVENLKEKWLKKNHININSLNFNNNPKNFSRIQDSLIREITKYFNKQILNVIKPDKKLSIISVEVRFKDELFAQLFNDKLVENVNDFYIQTKTKKEYQNVQILQHQADSVRNILNSSLGKEAATTDANPNPNPALHSLELPYKKRQIDVQANSSLYSEIVKNLEISKLSLRQETPLIQLLDVPILPLEVDNVGLVKSVFTGIMAGFLTGIFYIVLARFWVFIKSVA